MRRREGKKKRGGGGGGKKLKKKKKRGELLYIHRGGEKQGETKIKRMRRYDSERRSRVIPCLLFAEYGKTHKKKEPDKKKKANDRQKKARRKAQLGRGGCYETRGGRGRRTE